MSNKYCSNACEIFIPAEKLPEMERALIDDLSDRGGRSWEEELEYVRNYDTECSNLEAACRAYSWSIEWSIKKDVSGDATSILAYDPLSYYDCDRERFLEIIAPFVKDGGFVEMHGEDGDVFRVIFKDSKAIRIYPSISWDN